MLFFLQTIVYIDELIVMLIFFLKKYCCLDYMAPNYGFFSCDIMTLMASSHVMVHLTFVNML